MSPTVIRFNPNDPNFRAIRELAQSARAGKIIAFHTETVYGIGVPASNKAGVDKLYAIKEREREKPFAYHIGDWEQLTFLDVVRSPAFRYLSKKFWPGPVTLIAQTHQGEKIGIRYPRSISTTTLITSTGEPFLGTSANLSGQPSPKAADEVIRSLRDKVDFLIDAGRSEFAQDSTVVDITVRPPQILREGAEIEAVRGAVEDVSLGKVPRKKIMIVCTGNSCRSPMAAGLLMDELKHRRLDREIEIATSGILARDGGMATAEAILVMKNREIDISGHRTRSCRRDDILGSDLILAMSQEHYDFLAGLVPGVKDKIKVLDVKDPIGQGIPVYEETVQDLEKKLKKEWDLIVQ